jgi:ferredoxin-type protein NapG
MATKLTRRHLFRLKPGELLQLFHESPDPKRSSGETTWFRPPGAAPDEESFLSTCERCHKCSEACPYEVIEHLGPVGGLAEGTPVVDPGAKPCRWCPTMDCIRSCPSGALALDPSDTAAPIGKAVLDLSACLNEHGTLCDACAVHCPPQLKAITMIGRKPHLDAQRCTGCGLCAYFCESSPPALRIVKGVPVNQDPQ